jgi:hypothetical protein
MVEVFKTNVTDRVKAEVLIAEIQKEFGGCRASFDLEDCDRVLVVRSIINFVDSEAIIRLLYRFGYDGQVLPDA